MALAFVAIVSVLSLLALFYVTRLERQRKQLDKEIYRGYWQTKIMVNLEDPGRYKLAVIEADKLLDRALKERGCRGQTMGERLVSGGEALSDKDAVWGVHKLRNRLVHEMDGGELNLLQTKRALAIFARALKDVGAL